MEELLTGERRPLSLNEFCMWSTYYKIKKLYADQNMKK